MSRALIAAVLVAGVALLGAAPAGAGSARKTVKLYDNYFEPSRLTVDKGTTIVWKWPDEAIDVHDVKLRKGPNGVRRFWSQPASSGYTFKRTLKKAGRYDIVCTLHPEEMTMTIKVRRG